MFVTNSAGSNPFARAIAIALIVALFYISLAVACFYGVGKLMRISAWLRPGILLCGALLVWIGLKLLRSLPQQPSGARAPSAKSAISAAFAVAWLNPQALIAGTMMLGAFRSTQDQEAWLLFMAGVGTASLAWSHRFAAALGMFRGRVGTRFFRNLVCGCVIICYGLKLLYDFAGNLSGAG